MITFKRSLLPLVCVALITSACSDSDSSNNATVDPVESRIASDSAVMNLNEGTEEGIMQAAADLERAVLLDPNNDVANLLVAPTRIVAFATSSSSSESRLNQLLTDAGVSFQGNTAFDVLFGSAPAPVGTDPLPDTTPSGAIAQAFLRHDFLPLLRESIANLEAVRPSFSEMMTMQGSSFELDYGDAQVLAGLLRTIEIQLLFALILDLNADIDALANWERAGLDAPYRFFAGESSTNIVPGATVQIGQLNRLGFLNEAATLLSQNTLRAVPGADAVLLELRDALVGLIDVTVNTFGFVDDLNSADDMTTIPPADRLVFNTALPWVQDLRAALLASGSTNMNDFVVEPLMETILVESQLEVIDLPGFTLRSDLLFNPELWDGRVILPDYTANGGTPVATLASYQNLDLSALNLVIEGLGGEPEDAASLLEFWNEFNRGWDEIFIDKPLEFQY